jgi:hypothetical protein
MQQSHTTDVGPLPTHLFNYVNALWYDFFFIRFVGKRANIGATI